MEDILSDVGMRNRIEKYIAAALAIEMKLVSKYTDKVIQENKTLDYIEGRCSTFEDISGLRGHDSKVIRYFAIMTGATYDNMPPELKMEIKDLRRDIQKDPGLRDDLDSIVAEAFTNPAAAIALPPERAALYRQNQQEVLKSYHHKSKLKPDFRESLFREQLDRCLRAVELARDVSKYTIENDGYSIFKEGDFS